MKKTNIKKKHDSKKVKEKIISTDDNYPKTVVKVISIIGYISAGFGILIGLALLLGGQFLVAMLSLEQIPEFIGAIAGILLIILAVLILIFSVFWIFVSKALWNHKNWARIVFIVFAALGVLNSLVVLPNGVFPLLIDGAIVYFLGFDESVKRLFK